MAGELSLPRTRRRRAAGSRLHRPPVGRKPLTAVQKWVNVPHEKLIGFLTPFGYDRHLALVCVAQTGTVEEMVGEARYVVNADAVSYDSPSSSPTTGMRHCRAPYGSWALRSTGAFTSSTRHAAGTGGAVFHRIDLSDGDSQ